MTHLPLVKEAVCHDEFSSEDSQRFCSNRYGEDLLYVPDSDEGIFNNNNTMRHYYQAEDEEDITGEECVKKAEFGTDGDSAMFDDDGFDKQMVDVAIQLNEEELNLMGREDHCMDGAEELANNNKSSHILDQGQKTNCYGSETTDCEVLEGMSESLISYDPEQTTDAQLDDIQDPDQAESCADVLDLEETDVTLGASVELGHQNQDKIMNKDESLISTPQTPLDLDSSIVVVSSVLLLRVCSLDRYCCRRMCLCWGNVCVCVCVCEYVYIYIYIYICIHIHEYIFVFVCVCMYIYIYIYIYVYI